ncbi:MAG: helicase [Leptospirales bacterium]|nr:helicase [Leptospirales bacterium]
MAEENVLQQELDKLDLTALKRVAQLWNIPKLGAEKKAVVKRIVEAMRDEFYLKGVLEKLSATQVTIYVSILKTRASQVLTLGEIARRISMPPVNAEMELGVLKRYFLVYQRKNRERLTNNLDKYYYYGESGAVVRHDANDKGQKFRLSLARILQDRKKLPPDWKKFAGVKGDIVSPDVARALITPEALDAALGSLSDIERETVQECFEQGGMLEITRAREIIQQRRGKWEEVVRRLDDLGLLLDEYYIDEKFIRILAMPQEVFNRLVENPLLPLPKKGQRKRIEKIAANELDFFLNLKKMIVYISRKGLNLAKSGKIKQIDLKETENRLLRPDISLFIEKSQIYQIELLLPVMRLLDVVRVKRDDVVLRNDYESVLDRDPFELMRVVMEEAGQARSRRVRYEDVFEPMYVPFYMPEIFDQCVGYIARKGRVVYTVIMAAILREQLLLAKGFRIKNFQQDLADLRRELISALFYLQLFGLIAVEFPDRWVELSELGLHYLKSKPLHREDEKGGVIINPDLSLIAIPEKISIHGVYTLKTFCEMKSFDNVYTFQITRESFQEGLLLKEKAAAFTELLTRASRSELSQNLLFSIEDWSKNLPLVTITDECVVVQTPEPNHMELLLGQISGKKIVLQKISPTTILIDAEKIYETIAYAEKLNLIVRLIR